MSDFILQLTEQQFRDIHRAVSSYCLRTMRQGSTASDFQLLDRFILKEFARQLSAKQPCPSSDRDLVEGASSFGGDNA